MMQADIDLTARGSSISWQGSRHARSIRQEGGSAEFLRLDVTRESDTRELVEYVEAHHRGAPDLLINNAGVCLRGQPTPQAYRTTLQVNTWAPLRLLEAFLPRMVTRR